MVKINRNRKKVESSFAGLVQGKGASPNADLKRALSRFEDRGEEKEEKKDLPVSGEKRKKREHKVKSESSLPLPKKQKGYFGEEDKSIHLRIPSKEFAWLRAICEANGMTMNRYCYEVISNTLKKELPKLRTYYATLLADIQKQGKE